MTFCYLRSRCFGEASDPVPCVLDRAGPTTTTIGTSSAMLLRWGQYTVNSEPVTA